MVALLGCSMVVNLDVCFFSASSGLEGDVVFWYGQGGPNSWIGFAFGANGGLLEKSPGFVAVHFYRLECWGCCGSVAADSVVGGVDGVLF